MKFLTRTIIILVILSLTSTSPTLATKETSRDTTLSISGFAGMSGVRIVGLPGNPVTDQNGNYSATVPYGFTGKVMPAKEGFAFTPPIRVYDELSGNIDNQDYVPSVIRFTISGNAGIDGASMKGLPGEPVTDRAGYYSVTVDYGWSGTVTPTKEGCIFEPANRIYSRVTADQTNENFAVKFDDGNFDSYGSPASSRSTRGRRGSAPGMGMMYGSSDSRRTMTGTSGYNPAIRSGGRKALVIPDGEIKPKELAEMVEDMQVMSLILDERFKETRRIQGLFTDFGAFFGRDNRSTEATYLQGFGVLFLMEVNFTFTSPPQRPARDPNETSEAVDSTWQKARQQVLSPGTSAGTDDEDSARKYDSQMVEELKKELVEALRHAGNIRHIGSDEWIILTVIGGQRQFGMGFGGPPRMGGSSGGAMMGGTGGYGGGFVMGGYGSVGGTIGVGAGGGMGGMYSGMATYGGTIYSSSTVLTIRARKSHVDDLAAGRMNLEQFQKNVQIFTY